MSTIIVAAILVGSVAAICFILINIHNKHKRKALSALLNQFSKEASHHNLNFSSQEILTHWMVGLDGVNRKLLIVSKDDITGKSQLISLNEIRSCTVQKQYGSLGASEKGNGKPEKYLETITLRLDLLSGTPVEIVFYNNIENNMFEIMELEQKAKHWETMLTKMQKPALRTA